ncbi:11045_t:CDS:2, partial [Acaulospora colombiana]
MTDNLVDAAEFTFVQACGLIPIVGTIIAAIAQSIIDRASKAEHNKKACEYISQRVKENLQVIAKAGIPPNSSVEKAKTELESALRNIELYIIEINKPGEFTQKFKKWLKDITNENDIAAASDNLLKKLQDATDDFCRIVALDTNKQIQEGITSVHEGLAALQIMMTQKGGDSVTEKEINESRLGPYFIMNSDDYDDEDNSSRNKNIRKKEYIGDDVAVKELENSDLKLERIVKQAKIVKLL